MKKFIALTAAVAMALTLTACGSQKINTDIETEKYTDGDMEDTTHNLLVTLGAMGIDVDKMKYMGDDACNADVIEKMKDMGLVPQDSEAKDCIGYEVDYHYSRELFPMVRNLLGGKMDFEEHEDVQIWFVKNDSAEDELKWEFVSMGDEVI